MLYGGMPKVLLMDDDRDIKAYLISLYKEMYVRCFDNVPSIR